MIALCFQRSDWQIIAMLGVWKAGAVVVPLDPNQPELRLKFILSDTESKLILTTVSFRKKLSDSGFCSAYEIFAVDSMEGSNFGNSPRVLAKSSDLAYVIYTSGTTGQPKGVLVEHSSLVNLSFSLKDRYDLSPGENMLQIYNFIFDGFLEPFSLSLLQGHTLTLATPSLTDLAGMVGILSGVTHLDALPSILTSIDLNSMTALRRIVMSGESAAPSVLSILSSIPSQPKIFNAYGPTETTVTATVQEVKVKVKDRSQNIGKPIFNYSVYILNSELKLMPLGAVGEIHIGGAGVSRGYLKQADLTKIKFKAVRWSSSPSDTW